ncbi:MAG: penicillin-binding protein 2 [Chloroflexota bacterium]
MTHRNNDIPPQEITLETFRLRSFVIALIFILGIFVFRLFWLQILEGPEWIAQAAENRLREISLPSLRGIIFDRNNTILARNLPSYNIVITSAYLPDDIGEVQEIYLQLSKITGIPVHQGNVETDTYTPCVPGLGIAEMVLIGGSIAPYQPVKIQCDIDPQIAKIVMEKSMDWPGVEVEVEAIRDYPTGELTAILVGFLGPIPASEEAYWRDLGYIPQRDKVGYAGSELAFQDILAGKNGKRVVEVDVAGQILRDVAPPIAPTPGYNIRLTIDTRLQNAAQAILISELSSWNVHLGRILSDNGVVIAMNPKTGEILAMVSYPSYENNRMARFIPAYYWEQLNLDEHKPLLNHAIGAEHPPGSVFKLVTAVGALNEGIVTLDQQIQTPGKITVQEKFLAYDPGSSREFVDWKPEGFGALTFTYCIANSSNVCFYKLGGGYQDEIPEGLGICRIGAYAYALGFGQTSPIELLDKADGLIPTPTWKRIYRGENWSTGDTYIATVGQGYILATPLQILTSAAIIANDGKYMAPTILREVLDGEGNVIQPFEPKLVWDITQDPIIDEYLSDEENTLLRSCRDVSHKMTVEPWVLDAVQQGMHLAVLQGTLKKEFEGVTIAAAGKTGTAEYCDKYAMDSNLCTPGNWPTHAWTVAYAPYDDPEIVVIAFVYHGGEGASVAGPIVRRMLEAYFEIKAIDAASGGF